jgi:YfiH family protein
MTRPILHRLLTEAGVEHGFGVRGSTGLPDLRRPLQVHGNAVVVCRENQDPSDESADAIVCREPGLAIGVITADCLPILACSDDGTAVAAIHAGWRGLSAGVIEAGIEALREIAPRNSGLRAVVGPHIGRCCYEVDTPVLAALASRLGSETLERTSVQTRPSHARIDLWELACAELLRIGIPASSLACVTDPCTSCDATRFHSFRRDAASAGRLIHAIAPRKARTNVT